MPDFSGLPAGGVTILSSFGPATCGFDINTWGAPTAGAVWPSANRALYTAVLVEVPLVAKKIAVLPTVQSGNLDVGIYTEDGTRLVSMGSTAVGTASAVQVLDITDTTLNPGTYFLAMNCDNTTAAFQRSSAGITGTMSAFGLQQQAVGAIALPATATFANISSAYLPVINAICMSSTI